METRLIHVTGVLISGLLLHSTLVAQLPDAAESRRPVLLQEQLLTQRSRPASQVRAMPDGIAFDWIATVGGISYAVCANGNLVCTSAGRRLVVLDISSPSTPVFHSNILLGGVVRDIKIAGTVAYVALEYGGFSIVDIADPSHPQEVGHLGLEFVCTGLALKGNYALVVNYNTGVKVVDVSTASNPVQVAEIQTPVTSVSVYGDYLYVNNSDQTLSVFDIADPLKPQLLVVHPYGFGTPYRLIVQGSFAYAAAVGGTEMRILDISNLSNIRQIGVYHTPRTRQIWDIRVVGTLGYVASDDGLVVVNLADPENAVTLGRFQTEGQGVMVEVVGKFAYLADLWDNLRVIDVNQPTGPYEVGAWTALIADGFSLQLVNGRAYVLTSRNGINILDVTNPYNIGRLGFYFEHFTSPVRAAINGTALYASYWKSDSLRVIDVSVPSHAVLVGTVNLNPGPVGLAAANQYLYVGGGEGFKVMDLSDAFHPSEVGSLSLAKPPAMLVLKDSLIFCVGNDKGLRILSVSTPNSPKSIGLAGDKYYLDVAIAGHYAYCLDYMGDSVDVYDWYKPAAPTLVDAVPGPFAESCLSILGSYLLVGSTFLPLQVYDLTDPAHPVNIFEIGDSDASSRGAAVEGEYLYVLDLYEGMNVYHIRTVPTPGGILVKNTQDDGPGSFRQALSDANAHTGPDTINFVIPQSDRGYNAAQGVWTIQPSTSLPSVTDPQLVINGWTQRDFAGGDRNPFGPEIEIDGRNVTNSPVLMIETGGVEVFGLVINRCTGAAIRWDHAYGGSVMGCYLGTTARGDSAAGNAYGVRLTSGTRFVTIGSSEAAELGNLISGNEIGVLIQDSSISNSIVGNTIGLDRTWTKAIGNTFEGIIAQDGCDGTEVLRNTIGANTHGISIVRSSYAIIAHNLVGTNATFVQDNGHLEYGIRLDEAAGCSVQENVVGYNKTGGVFLIGPNCTGNRITQNQISRNAGNGISLAYGANKTLKPPTVLSVSASTVSGTAGPGQTVEIFADDSTEGRIYLGSGVANASGAFAVSIGSVPLQNITATAIDSTGNTSQFSLPLMTEVVEENGAGQNPKEYALFQCYPNPFNATTVIGFQLPVASDVRLAVFDLLGREVSVLVDERRDAGVHEVKFDASRFASGVYLCRMSVTPRAPRNLFPTHGRGGQAGIFVEVKKLVVLK